MPGDRRVPAAPLGEPSATPAEIWRRSLRLHRLLIIASLLVPALAFAIAAVAKRADLLHTEEQTMLRVTDIVYEHARKVFQTGELVLDRIEDRVRGADWETIETPAMNAFLAELKKPLEHAVSIWISDANGNVRAGSQPWSSSTHIQDRDHYLALRERNDAGTFVGSVFVGRTTGIKSFAMARRLPTADGSFGGVIHISLTPSYFEDFFGELLQGGGHALGMARTDGALLARFPPPPVYGTVPPDNLVMRALAARPEGGSILAVSPVDGLERVAGYRLLPDYSIWVAAGIETRLIFKRWYESLWQYGLIAGLSALTLALVAWLALRRTVALREEAEQRLAAEKRLFHAQKLEGIGQLTGGVAHDFNNLLAVVMGNLSLIKQRIPANNYDLHRFIDRAIQGADRGAQLTQHLLSFARRQELRPRSIDLRQLVSELSKMMRRTLGGQTAIETRLPDSLPGVKVDPDHLELALLNLAVNARDAMPDGGTIVISGRAETLDHSSPLRLKPGEYVVIAVSDTGIGMDGETLARATEPFFTTKKEGKGTGLGLSAVEGLAAQSGGTFRLSSKPGAGTTAEIWLPVSIEPASTARAPDPEVARSLPPCTVLVVDDDALVAAGTVDMLVEMGHTPLSAASGEQALELLADRPDIDAVVTDQSMPGMTGTELASHIRAVRPSLPILLISGHADLAPGADPHLPLLVKPFRAAQLADMLARIIGPPPAKVAVSAA